MRRLRNTITAQFDSWGVDPSRLPERLFKALAREALALKQHPNLETLDIHTVTGTSGKTSVAFWLNSILNSLNLKSEYSGTLSGNLTSVGTKDYLKLRLNSLELGKKNLCTELSSHGIEQDRHSASRFTSLMFTNLSQDHLDYHGTMESYYQAKKKLFTEIARRNHWLYGHYPKIFIQTSNTYSKRLYSELSRVEAFPNSLLIDCNITSFESSHGWHSFIDQEGDKFQSRHPGVSSGLNLNLICTLLKKTFLLTPEKINSVLKDLPPVPGRMESLWNDKTGVQTLIDYAHKPAALENLLLTVKSSIAPGGRIILVFGCGGNRDRLKRPIMATIAERIADRIIVTEDNCRDESIEDIFKDIAQGFSLKNQVIWIEDRGEAIKKSIQIAKRGDWIVLAGKGHETYIEKRGEKIPFSDSVTARHLQL